MKPEAREAHLAKLVTAVEELQSSEGWQRWLISRRYVRHYSFRNQILIASQMPEATRVMGFRPWLKHGRCVNKGEHGIRILGPANVKRKGRDGAVIIDPETGLPTRRTIFVEVSVFDISQTHEIEVENPLPLEPPGGDLSVEGDNMAAALAYEKLVEWLQGRGWTYTLADAAGQAYGGFANVTDKLVLIVDRGTLVERLRVMVHECVHTLGVTRASEGSVNLAEAVTEATAHLVLQELGVVSATSVPYIASWSQDPQEIIKHLDRVSKLADELLAVLTAEAAPVEVAA